VKIRWQKGSGQWGFFNYTVPVRMAGESRMGDIIWRVWIMQQELILKLGSREIVLERPLPVLWEKLDIYEQSYGKPVLGKTAFYNAR
jgi:hypothetical protein